MIVRSQALRAIAAGIPFLLCIACSPDIERESVSAEAQERGRLLAAQHCIACHQVPEPDLLTKRSWEFTLTYMGFFLGIDDVRPLEQASESTRDSIALREEFVRAAKMFPEVAALSQDDWETLRSYYVANAPEIAISMNRDESPEEDTSQFRPRSTQYRMETAITSMVHIDEAHGLLYIHDSGSEQLTVLDRNLSFYDNHPSPGVALVDAHVSGDDLYLLSIGDLFASNIGTPLGEVQKTRVLGGVFMGLEVLVDSLHRPADFQFADLDNDGLDELLVSNFGDYTGNFSIYRKESPEAPYDSTPQILSAQPGIVKGEAVDLTGDGYRDIVVMASAGRENVSVFVNNKDGAFRQETLWEMHPSFGYIGFELRDFDGDGQLDLLTLNGDNGDSDPYNTLKRDHGIRIYLNHGDLKFEEAYFYPMYGVYGAEIEDFDEDGDLDIAAIAFHPDFSREKLENFVYLEQTGSLEFAAKTHPSTYNGRWLTIDSGDVDGDGDKDIVLGAAYVPVGMRDGQMDLYEKLLQEGPPILVLENRMPRP